MNQSMSSMTSVFHGKKNLFVFMAEVCHRIHGAAILIVTWIPSIYPLYVSIVSINIPAPWIRHGVCSINGSSKKSLFSPRFDAFSELSQRPGFSTRCCKRSGKVTGGINLHRLSDWVPNAGYRAFGPISINIS